MSRAGTPKPVAAEAVPAASDPVSGIGRAIDSDQTGEGDEEEEVSHGSLQKVVSFTFLFEEPRSLLTPSGDRLAKDLPKKTKRKYKNSASYYLEKSCVM